MISRSKDFWLVAFFLSKYGMDNMPPVETETFRWNEAYRMFYEELGHGRTILSFEHSIKNARDSFDSHITDSDRRGWRDKEGRPRKLESVAGKIFLEYSDKSRNLIWNEIKKFADNTIKDLDDVINDLISIQESESEEPGITKTEGGKKVIISYKYERSISLRNLAFQIHGYNCAVCGFNFADVYGVWGDKFAEVHHIIPLSEGKEQERETNPSTDLIVLCANCHRMVHRKKGITLTVKELKSKMNIKI